MSVFSEVLLVSLPVPDFSMPFNVICFVSTAIAMLFGPIHSLTTKMLAAKSLFTVFWEKRFTVTFHQPFISD